MKITPLINALSAGIYILIVVGIISALQSPNTPDNEIIAPVFLLSLFTMSVAVMAFIFFYQPFKLYFDNHRKEALMYFVKTVGYFSGIVLISFFALLYFRMSDSVTFPKGGEKLIQGENYQITWTGGREEVTQIFLVDVVLKDQLTSASIVDRIYGIENKHMYNYIIPENIKPGKYEFQIGSQTSPTFEIISR